MAILTRAELAHYPGETLTEQSLHHHLEALGPGPQRRARSGGAVAALPRVLDLRPFPGRDRVERVKAWLVAHTPRAATWSDESLTELATRLDATSRVIE